MNTRSCTTQIVSDLITRSLAIAQKVCHSKENNGSSIEILTWKKGTIQLYGQNYTSNCKWLLQDRSTKRDRENLASLILIPSSKNHASLQHVLDINNKHSCQLATCSGGGATTKPANLVTGAAKETILGDPQGDRMRGVHLHQDNGLN